MFEIWKSIIGYEGLYEASNFGRIRSLNYKHTGETRILKLGKSTGGYLQVNLCKNGKVKMCLIHRLVFEAFNGKIPEGYDVNHINENKTDNRLENLNLMTRKENINYGTRTERCSKPVYQYTLDGVLVHVWPSTRECDRNGFNQSNVAKCCRGERKSHKGYIWSYVPLFFNEK